LLTPGTRLFAQAIEAERPEAARSGAEDLERKARFWPQSGQNAPKLSEI
jgi:hypothetical protein